MKYFGKIGYVETVNTPEDPDVYTERITERNYYGDVVRDNRNLESTSNLNDDFSVSGQFSIVADSYAYKHFRYIRYVEYLGVKWKVTSVDPLSRPRIIITVRGVYNAPDEEE